MQEVRFLARDETPIQQNVETLLQTTKVKEEDSDLNLLFDIP